MILISAGHDDLDGRSFDPLCDSIQAVVSKHISAEIVEWVVCYASNPLVDDSRAQNTAADVYQSALCTDIRHDESCHVFAEAICWNLEARAGQTDFVPVIGTWAHNCGCGLGQ